MAGGSERYLDLTALIASVPPSGVAAQVSAGFSFFSQSLMRSYLDFEKPVAELEAKVEELRAMATSGTPSRSATTSSALRQRRAQALRDLYGKLTPWQKTLVARHPQRPHFLDYFAGLITDFTPLAGDRKFGEDEAIVGGFGRFRGEPRLRLGQEKGHDTETRIRHNFGMAKPEGYRKAVRLMELADRFGLPVLSFVDTAGAYPGIGAEERGQAEAIARSTDACLSLGVPNVAIVIGEGGSGGAIADRHGQSRADARARDLQRDLAGGRRLDPVARYRQRPGCGDQHEDHRAGPAALRRHRRHRRGADRRRPSRSRCRHRRRRRRHRGRRSAISPVCTRDAARAAQDKFLAIGRKL